MGGLAEKGRLQTDPSMELSVRQSLHEYRSAMKSIREGHTHNNSITRLEDDDIDGFLIK